MMSFLKFALIFFVIFDLYGYESPRVRKGVLDLTNWQGETLKLDGEWYFYWKKFLRPDSLKEKGELVKVPGPWKKSLPRLGYGTFVLEIKGLKEGMGIRINENFSATKFYAIYPDQTSFLYGAGKVGKVSKEEIPEFSFHVVPFPRGGSFFLVIHISNFNYRYGGLVELRIGDYKSLKRKLSFKIYLDYLMMGVLLIMGFYHLGLYSQRKKNLDTLFFGILSLLLFVRIGIIGHHFIWLANILDIKMFSIMVSANYVLTIVIPLIGFSFIAYMFENKLMIKAQRPLYIFYAFFIIPFIFLPTHQFTLTSWKNFNHATAIFIFIFLIYQSLLMIFKGVRFSKLFMFSLCFVIMGFIYDLLTTFDLVPPGEIASFTFIFFIFTQSYILSLKFASAFNTAERLSNHLQEEVEIKTKDLKEEKERALNSEKEISDLLNNMKHAVFCIDHTCLVSPPVSLFSENIFEQKIEKKSVFDTLFKDLDRSSEVFGKVEMVFSVVFDRDDLQWDIMKDELPSKLKFENKVLKVAFAPILKEGLVSKVMLIVEDITEINYLERKVKEEEERATLKIKRLQEIVQNTKKEAKVFIRDTLVLLKSVQESIEKKDYDKLFRAIHTLKGNSRLYSLSGLSEEIHLIESQLETNRDLYKAGEDLNRQVYGYIDLIKDIFGQDVDETVLVDSDFVEIEKEKFFSTINNIKELLNQKNVSGALLEVTKIGGENLLDQLNVFHRTVQKMAISLKKKIKLNIKGNSIYLSLEKSMMIKDGLLHLVQNAADHGIEEEGTISIEIIGRDSFIDIIVSDNGKGIDPDKVLFKAIKKGIVSREETESFSQEQKLQLIMSAGFSTKEVATEYSGRGVGLDVVKVNIEKLGGSIDINSSLGQGTQFTISIPLT